MKYFQPCSYFVKSRISHFLRSYSFSFVFVFIIFIYNVLVYKNSYIVNWIKCMCHKPPVTALIHLLLYDSELLWRCFAIQVKLGQDQQRGLEEAYHVFVLREARLMVAHHLICLLLRYIFFNLFLLKFIFWPRNWMRSIIAFLYEKLIHSIWSVILFSCLYDVNVVTTQNARCYRHK